MLHIELASSARKSIDTEFTYSFVRPQNTGRARNSDANEYADESIKLHFAERVDLLISVHAAR